MAKKKMSDTELIKLVDNEFDTAMGREGQTISTQRALSMDYYMSRPIGNEIVGQSQVRTTTVSDVVDGIIPSLLRIFSIADNLVDFSPHNEDDIEKAKQESDTVNYVFFKENPAFMTLFSWFWDALVQKNGIVKTWWDVSEDVTSERYEGLSEMELMLLMSDEDLEPQEQDEREETFTQEIPTPLGIMPQQVTETVYDVTFRRTETRGKVTVEPIPPEEYRISSDANGLDPSLARFTGHEREITRSKAIEMGFDKKVVNECPQSSLANTGEEREARHKSEEEQRTSTPSTDQSQELILLREAYIKVDYNGDGVSQLRQVFTCGNELLGNEEADRQPFHVITPKPIPHKHFGRSIADLVMDIQEITTTLLRQALDNLYQANHAGHAVWEMGMGDNTMDDLLSTQAGRIVRTARPPQETITPMVTPYTAQHTFPVLEFFDKVTRDRTGITQTGEGLSPDELKNIQSSVMSQALDVSRGKIEAIARIFAETGIKSCMLHIHELLQKHQDKEMIIQLRGEFVPVNPSEWRKRLNMTVGIGLGLGSRETKLLHLQSIKELQREIVAGGGMGMLVTPTNLYNTADAFVKNADLKATDLYFTRPDPEETGVDPNADEESEFRQGLLQVEAQKNQLKAEKQNMDREKDMMTLQSKLADQSAKHATEIAKVNIARETMQNTLTVQMEQLRNQLTEFELKYSTNVPGAGL